MMRVVEVSRCHIEGGVVGSDHECPVACALSEVLGKPVEIWASGEVVEATGTGFRHLGWLGFSTLEIVLRYDETGIMAPFEAEFWDE